MISALLQLLLGFQQVPVECVQEDPDALGYYVGGPPPPSVLPACPNTPEELLAVIDGG